MDDKLKYREGKADQAGAKVKEVAGGAEGEGGDRAVEAAKEKLDKH